MGSSSYFLSSEKSSSFLNFAIPSQKLQYFALLCLWILPCFAVNIADMSLEEKVGQILMVHFHGEDVNEEAQVLIQDIKVGGIIYYNWSNGLTSAEQVSKLSVDLQKLAQATTHSIPLLIATDQEMGLVTRLAQGFTIFPGNKALAMANDPELAEKAAFCMGQQLKAVGINMNLAPVVDVNCNPKNPVIGIRSFGSDPHLVALFGEKMVAGFSKAGIITTLKHFPGHGDVEVDSHDNLPIIHKSLEELEQVEFIPFRYLASYADAIMTAHLKVPALDPDHCATLSKKTHSFLREHIGFQGLIISDSLVMEGVLKESLSIEEAAIETLKAGCDMLILGGKQLIGAHASLELIGSDIARIHEAIVCAVKSGLISESRLDEAVQKILNLKKRLPHSVDTDLTSINTDEDKNLALHIATSALKINQKTSLTLLDKKVLIVAPSLVKDSLYQTSLAKIGKETELFFFKDLSPLSSDQETIEQLAVSAEAFLICSYNAWKNPSQIALIQSLLKLEKPTILLILRDSLDEELFSQADLIVNTFSPTAPAFQAVFEYLAL